MSRHLTVKNQKIQPANTLKYFADEIVNFWLCFSKMDNNVPNGKKVRSLSFRKSFDCGINGNFVHIWKFMYSISNRHREQFV